LTSPVRDCLRHAECEGQRCCHRRILRSRPGHRVPTWCPVFFYDHGQERPYSFRAGPSKRFLDLRSSHMDLLRVGIKLRVGRSRWRHVPVLRGGFHAWRAIHRSATRERGVFPTHWRVRLRKRLKRCRGVHEFDANGWRNIAGGCCGTTTVSYPGHRGSGARTPRISCPNRQRLHGCLAAFPGKKKGPLVLPAGLPASLISAKTHDERHG